MTMMTPITPKPPATAIRHPLMDRAERLAACKAVSGDMLSEVARMFDLAAETTFEFRRGLHEQVQLRLAGVALLLAELDAQDGSTILSEIVDISDTPDPERIRDLAARLDAALGMELHSVKIGLAYERYA